MVHFFNAGPLPIVVSLHCGICKYVNAEFLCLSVSINTSFSNINKSIFPMSPSCSDLQCGLVLCVDGVHQCWGPGVILHAGVGSCSQQGGGHLSSCPLHAGVHQSGASGPVLGVRLCLIGPKDYSWYQSTINKSWPLTQCEFGVFQFCLLGN